MSLSEALAFDMYGTLVDPIRIWKQLEQYIPQNAQRIADRDSHQDPGRACRCTNIKEVHARLPTTSSFTLEPTRT